MTYGSLKAMGGKFNERELGGQMFWSKQDLARYLLLSIVIHWAILFFCAELDEFQASEASASTVVGITRLQVLLENTSEPETSDRPPPATLAEQQIGVRKADMQRGANFLRVMPDTVPELESDVSSDIDDARVLGFMILALEIDDHGVPSSANVIYSELPPEATDLLVKRFTAAKFRPAVKSGLPIAASILIRIDVE